MSASRKKKQNRKIWWEWFQRWGRKFSIWVINGNLTVVEIRTTTIASLIFSARENTGLFGYSNCMFLKLWHLSPIQLPFITAYKPLSAPETQPLFMKSLHLQGNDSPLGLLQSECQTMLSLKRLS